MTKPDSLSRNILINGGMHFFQRGGINTTVALTTSMAYSAPDRFRVAYSGTVTGTPSVKRSTSKPDGKSPYSLNFTSVRRNSSSVSLFAAQRVQSVNACEVSNDYVSLSFSYQTPTATLAIVTFRRPTVEDNYTVSNIIYTQTIAITPDNTWRKSVLEAILLPDVATGFEVEIALVIPSGTDAANTDHYLTQIKLNQGHKAYSFSMAGRSYTEEIQFCQHFYEKSHDHGIAPGNGSPTGGRAHGPTNVYTSAIYVCTTVEFKVQKRVAPTVIVYDGAGVPNCFSLLSAGGLVGSGNGLTPQSINVGETGFYCYLGPNSMTLPYYYWTADAEI